MAGRWCTDVLHVHGEAEKHYITTRHCVLAMMLYLVLVRMQAQKVVQEQVVQEVTQVS
jgi:hypothetical protein